MSLKDTDKLPLFIVLVVNFAVFYVAVKADAVLSGAWLDVAHSPAEALPAGFGLILAGVINAQLSPHAKARIVFLCWQDPLPGSQAFTRYAQTDSRIDLRVLKEEYGPLPTDPREQNVLWYKLYKSVEEDASVKQVHREFLFTRDYNTISMIMVFVLGVAGFVQIPSSSTSLIYFSVLVLQFLLTGRAARNHGQSFITTVLALKGAGR